MVQYSEAQHLCHATQFALSKYIYQGGRMFSKMCWFLNHLWKWELLTDTVYFPRRLWIKHIETEVSCYNNIVDTRVSCKMNKVFDCRVVYSIRIRWSIEETKQYSFIIVLTLSRCIQCHEVQDRHFSYNTVCFWHIKQLPHGYPLFCPYAQAPYKTEYKGQWSRQTGSARFQKKQVFQNHTVQQL